VAIVGENSTFGVREYRVDEPGMVGNLTNQDMSG